jgi:hypothetical protein
VAEQHPVSVQGALGRSGRAGGVDQDCRIIGARPDGREAVVGARQRRLEINRAGPAAVGREHLLEHRQIGTQLHELVGAGRVGDHRSGTAVGKPKAQRLGPEQAEQRHRDRSELVGC